MITATITFLTPIGGLVAFAVVAPITALAVATWRDRAGRTRLGLPRAPRDLAALAIPMAPLLLGLAAAQPAIQRTSPQHFRTNAQALFVFDVSGSMDASSSATSPTRLAQAQKVAVRLRGAIADVPSGVATLTTLMLPELLPTTDVATFDTTVDHVIGIEKPPPPLLSYGALATSFEAISDIRAQGYYAPSAKRRLLVLLTDGESAPYDPSATAIALTQPSYVNVSAGEAQEGNWPVSLLIVRVGSPSDHIYERDGAVDSAYRADASSATTVRQLASLSHGVVVTADQTGTAIGAMRRLLGRGREVTAGTHKTTLGLTRYVALAALLAICVVALCRNVGIRRWRQPLDS